MRRLYLVSCVSEKQRHPSAAKDLYVSDWFRKARRYAERNGEWKILSAKYGLVEPNTVLSPYEQTLNSMPIAQRRQWAETVMRELRTVVSPGDTVVFLAGQRYREFLAPALSDYGVNVEIPMEGLQIGRQLQWLSRRV